MGYWSQSTPSSSRPPDLAVRPPHCFQKKATPPRCSGPGVRAPRQDHTGGSPVRSRLLRSPSRIRKSRSSSAPSSGSALMNRRRRVPLVAHRPAEQNPSSRSSFPSRCSRSMIACPPTAPPVPGAWSTLGTGAATGIHDVKHALDLFQRELGMKHVRHAVHEDTPGSFHRSGRSSRSSQKRGAKGSARLADVSFTGSWRR